VKRKKESERERWNQKGSVPVFGISGSDDDKLRKRKRKKKKKKRKRMRIIDAMRVKELNYPIPIKEAACAF